MTRAANSQKQLYLVIYTPNVIERGATPTYPVLAPHAVAISAPAVDTRGKGGVLPECRGDHSIDRWKQDA